MARNFKNYLDKSIEETVVPPDVIAILQDVQNSGIVGPTGPPGPPGPPGPAGSSIDLTSLEEQIRTLQNLLTTVQAALAAHKDLKPNVAHKG